MKHLVKANILAMHAILKVRPDALFIQSESTEYFHAESPAAIGPGRNEQCAPLPVARPELRPARRFEMYEYLLDNGMTRDEYHFFLNNNLKHHCIMGNDYYQTNEHYVSADGSTRSAGEIFGYAVITHQYYNRYRLPVMHTETNLCQGPRGDEAVHWLRKEWANVLRVRNNGVPLVGFTWYSLTDQVDWDTACARTTATSTPSACSTSTARSARSASPTRNWCATGWKCCRPRACACRCRS
jgi:hypothetical protein